MVEEREEQVVETESYADHPALACGPEGEVWLAWVETLRDKVVVEKIGSGRVEIEAPRPLGPLALAVSPDGERAIVGWTEGARRTKWAEVDNGLGLKVLFSEAGSDPTVCFDSEGRAWLLWCSEDGHLTASLEGKGVREVGGFDARRPSLAPLPKGEVLVAWDDATPEGMGIFVAILGRRGNVEEGPYCLTRRLRLNFCPCAVADQVGRAFVAWENCRTNILGRGFDHLGSEEALRAEDEEMMGGHGYRLERVILGAVRSDGTFRWLGGMLGDTPLPLALDAVKPSLVVDHRNRVWLLYQSYDGGPGWEVWMRLLSTGVQSQPFKVGEGGGPYSRRPAVCASPDGTIWVAWQRREGKGKERESRIVLAKLKLTETPRAWDKPISRPIALSRPRKPRQRRRYTTQFEGRKFSLYFGDLHMHSELSGCSRHKDGNLREKYEFARRVGGWDFAAITDHSREFNDYDWALLQEMAKAFYKPGEFVPFLAFEFIVNRPGLCFHRQVIYRDPEGPLLFRDDDPRVKRNADIWRIIGESPVIAVLHQPADEGMERVYEDHNPHYQPLVEIYQVRGSYEKWGGKRWVYEHMWRLYCCAPDAPEFYRNKPHPEDWARKGLFVQDALAQGLIFGFSGGGEHEGSGITGVYAEELTREALFEALRARRCYATTGAKIVLDVRLGDKPLGSVVEGVDEVRLHIMVKGTAPLRGLTIVKDNVDVFEFDPRGTRETELDWLDEGAPSAPDWEAPHHCYYVRVEQEDGHMAWSSPIFVKA